MKLENLNLVELNAQEMKEFNGGLNWLWQAAVGTFVYNVFSDWGDNMKAFKRGAAAGKE
jgi:hypothetical protein